MGFIPLPLGVVMLRVVYTSMKSTNPGKLGQKVGETYRFRSSAFVSNLWYRKAKENNNWEKIASKY